MVASVSTCTDVHVRGMDSVLTFEHVCMYVISIYVLTVPESTMNACL